MADQRPPTLLFLTDAIRGDAITPEDMPFLHQLLHDHSHAKTLRPNFGFCERVEFFTGTHPDTNGYLCALTLDQPSEFQAWDTSLARLIDWESDYLRPQRRRLMRGWFKRLRGIRQPIYEIPMRLLPRVGLTEDQWDFFTDLGKHSVETIFDVMKREGRSWNAESFISLKRPVHDDVSYPSLLENLGTHSDLFLLYQGMGDAIGHEFGPESEEHRAMRRKLDERIATVVRDFQRLWPEGRFIIHGDHGMVPVTEHVDLAASMCAFEKDSGMRCGLDFEIWLDSTMLRVWPKHEYCRHEITGWLTHQTPFTTSGMILTEEDCQRLRVPPPGGKYGDIYWLANPGVLVFPDFFRRDQPAKGMHGYETHIPEQQTYALWHHPGREKTQVDQIEGVDICALLADMLDIPAPQNCEGKSPLGGAR